MYMLPHIEVYNRIFSGKSKVILDITYILSYLKTDAQGC